MARAQTETQEPSALDVMARMAEILERQEANAPRRILELGDPEYQARLKAEGFMDRFPTRVFQNGREAEARGLPVLTRERASSLKPGTYLGKRVTVHVDAHDRVHLAYKSNSIEDRMRQPWKTFEELIDLLWAEMYPDHVPA